MVILTVIRRLAIFVIAVALLINSVLMVLAKSAGDRKQTQSPTYKVKAFVSKREEAYNLAKDLKLEQGRYRVMEVPVRRQVPTSGFLVEMKFTQAAPEQVDSVANAVRNQGFPVAVEVNEDGSRAIRLKQVYGSKSEASRTAGEIERKTSGVFKFSVVPATKTVNQKAWCLEVSVADAETVRSLKERLKGKASLDVR